MKNPTIKINDVTLVAKNWHPLKKVTFELENEKQVREIYDRPNGATILLYNSSKQTIILTRQFRIPTYLNGNATGMLIETPAGLLDKDGPEEGIRRETEEETGYRIKEVKKIFEVYMSPGSVSELIYFYTAEYDDSMKVSSGGGVDEEKENIEVLELPMQTAISLIDSGEIQDGKTIMLLQYAKLNDLV